MRLHHHAPGGGITSGRRFDAPLRQRVASAAAAGQVHSRSVRQVRCSTATIEDIMTAESGGSKRSGSPVPCPILDQAPVHEAALTVSDALAQHGAAQASAAAAALQTSAAPSNQKSRVRKPPAPYAAAFKQGDVVYARVTYVSERGAKAEVMYHQGLMGFMPADQSPLTPEQWASAPGRPKPWSANAHGDKPAPGAQHAHGVAQSADVAVFKGHTRPFKVAAIPPGMRPGEKGPLLSAYRYDQDMLWSRVSQIHQLSKEDELGMPMNVTVHGYDAHGLKASLCGLEATIPCEHVRYRPGLSWDQVAQQLVGQDIEVCMLVDKFNAATGSIVLSESLANWKRLTRPGTFVWGKVSKSTQYGVFVHIEALDCDGLLHLSNLTTDDMISHPLELFSIGEVIPCVMRGADADGRLSLSTKLLEQEYGELVTAKAHVFARTAEGPAAMAVLPHEVQLHDGKDGQHSGRRQEDAVAGRRHQGGQQTYMSSRSSSDAHRQHHSSHNQRGGQHSNGQQRWNQGSQRSKQGPQKQPTAAHAAAEERNTVATAVPAIQEAADQAVQDAAAVPATHAAVPASYEATAAANGHFGAEATEALVLSHACNEDIRGVEVTKASVAAANTGAMAIAGRAASRSEYWQQWLE